MSKQTVLLCAALLCAACAEKKQGPEPAPATPPESTFDGPPWGDNLASPACAAGSRRLPGCLAELTEGLDGALSKHAPALKDPHVKGAMKRMRQMWVRALLHHTAKSSSELLVKWKDSICRADKKEWATQRQALTRCAKAAGCKAFGACVVKHGAFTRLIDAAKKMARESKTSAVRPPLNLAYHWQFFLQLSGLVAISACACRHWLAAGLPPADGRAPKTPARTLPWDAQKCKPFFERPGQCVEALWAQVTDRNRRTRPGNAETKDTSASLAEARRQLQVVTGQMLTASQGTKGNKTTCPFDRAKQAPADVRPLERLLVQCALEKTCQGYAACLRRAADLP